jgi:hypothetical protein
MPRWMKPQPPAPFRRIVKWIGPAATRVQLECGHVVATHAAHKTRCGGCARDAAKQEKKR